MLVDRDGVIREVDVGAQRHVVELVQIRIQSGEHAKWNAQRADRIPHADEMDSRFVRMLLSKIFRGGRLRIAVLRAIAIEAKRVVEQTVVILANEPGVSNETRKASYGIRASAESKEIDVITRHVLLHEPAIAIFDVLIDAVAGDALEQIAIGGVNVQQAGDLLDALL